MKTIKQGKKHPAVRSNIPQEHMKVIALLLNQRKRRFNPDAKQLQQNAMLSKCSE